MTNFDFRFFLFDFLSTAIQANVISRETFGNDWIRFTIQIGHMFKHGNLRLKKPLDYLWIPMSDFQCKCPKLKIKHTYLILGKFSKKKEKKIIIRPNHFDFNYRYISKRNITKLSFDC